MFADSKSDKVAYFGVWADAARDRSFFKDAHRIYAAAVERCVARDLRTCPETQGALNWLAGNGYSSAVAHFRRAFACPSPLEREAAAMQVLAYLR
ncbi:hypothetical protein [Chelatococcus asaccharovorans]|uniref:hypothetical protein n=1 Tax=Chelatococcus asaccharovorans TaxID=28210 RepID=UPI00224C7158|nr:hypothetical protein [Chelatococcus asaccharovorans]CAH1658617.1 conserved hypothetical protein [Chelatococcus asaccharovorans]CAH1688520.1 conserved hypothetical protein [Chelatococcus asaccharovorans]